MFYDMADESMKSICGIYNEATPATNYSHGQKNYHEHGAAAFTLPPDLTQDTAADPVRIYVSEWTVRPTKRVRIMTQNELR